MLSRWLEKTRQKSDEEKRFVALSISFVITAFIFAGWLFFITSTHSDNKENIASRSTASPIQSVKNLFKNLVE